MRSIYPAAGFTALALNCYEDIRLCRYAVDRCDYCVVAVCRRVRHFDIELIEAGGAEAGEVGGYGHAAEADRLQWEAARRTRQLLGKDCDGEIVVDAPVEEGYVQCVLPHIRVDDWVFGVSSVSKDGFESPVASAVPGGAFKPYVAPEKK